MLSTEEEGLEGGGTVLRLLLECCGCHGWPETEWDKNGASDLP